MERSRNTREIDLLCGLIMYAGVVPQTPQSQQLQAPSIAAGVILGVDMIHRAEGDLSTR
jgi:hypothetical protein